MVVDAPIDQTRTHMVGGGPPLDIDAFSEFCRQVQGRLIGAVTLYCGDSTLAEDAAQEALARAWRDWGHVSNQGTPEAWVFKTAFNVTNSWFRRLKIAKRHAETDSSGTHSHPEQLERSWEVRDAVRALPARQREAVVLRFFADLSVADTATAMRCAEGTVRALTAQGVAALRTSIRPSN